MFNVPPLRAGILFAALVLTGCEELLDSPRHMSVVVDGLPVGGDAQDAKANEFTSCELAGKNYRCIAERTVNIYGVPAKKAYVMIDREAHTYRDIYLFIEPQKYDVNCLENIPISHLIVGRREECALPSDFANLQSAMGKNGWLQSPNSFGNGLHFYNRDYAVKIVLSTASDQYANLILGVVSEKYAMIRWKEAKVVHDRETAVREQEKALRDKEEASKPEVEAFIDSMKR